MTYITVVELDNRVCKSQICSVGVEAQGRIEIEKIYREVIMRSNWGSKEEPFSQQVRKVGHHEHLQYVTLLQDKAFGDVREAVTIVLHMRLPLYSRL